MVFGTRTLYLSVLRKHKNFLQKTFIYLVRLEYHTIFLYLIPYILYVRTYIRTYYNLQHTYKYTSIWKMLAWHISNIRVE